jgi:hypothetical protein
MDTFASRASSGGRLRDSQTESGITFGIIAALYGAIIIKGGRVEKSNFGPTRCRA